MKVFCPWPQTLLQVGVGFYHLSFKAQTQVFGFFFSNKNRRNVSWEQVPSTRQEPTLEENIQKSLIFAQRQTKLLQTQRENNPGKKKWMGLQEHALKFMQ